MYLEEMDEIARIFGYKKEMSKGDIWYTDNGQIVVNVFGPTVVNVFELKDLSKELRVCVSTEIECDNFRMTYRFKGQECPFLNEIDKEWIVSRLKVLAKQKKEILIENRKMVLERDFS